jgi:membrane associated rhomboid family serine protease
MGIYDRDYVFNRGGGFGSRPAMLSVTAWLIIVNIGVFLLQAVTQQPVRGGSDLMTQIGHFSTYKVTWDGGLQFWRFLTFQFLHSGLMHIAFNMFGLYMFGPMVEQQLGRRKYLAFYLTCGLFGAFTYFLLNALGAMLPNLPFVLINNPQTQLVGASAGVFGVIVACARISPNTTVQLIIPPVPVKLKYLAYAYVGIATFTVLTRGHNAGGEAAHLGGAAAGFFFIRHSHLLRDFWDVVTDSRKPRKVRTSDLMGNPKLRIARDDESELDALLDRVNQVGHANLTKREKDRLAELTRRRREADGRP